MRKLEGYTIMNYNYETRFKELTDICRRKNVVITSEFTNMRTKVKFKCLKCGTLGEKVPSLLKTQECPCKECRKMCIILSILMKSLKSLYRKSVLVLYLLKSLR